MKQLNLLTCLTEDTVTTNTPEAQEFLRALYGESPAVFQSYDDSQQKRKELVWQKCMAANNALPILGQLNAQGAGCFVTINKSGNGKRREQDIDEINALFVDHDVADDRRCFDRYGLAPSIIVESSPGRHHCYWLAEPGFPLERFRSAQEKLIAAFGADDKIKDLPRVMRIPGFLHLKGEPFLSRLLQCTGKRYSLSEIDTWLESLPEPKTKKKRGRQKERPRAAAAGADGRDRYAGVALQSALEAIRNAVEGERNDSLNRQAHGVFGLVKAGRLDEIATWEQLRTAASDCGLEDGEVETTLSSAWAGAEARYEGQNKGNPDDAATTELSPEDEEKVERLSSLDPVNYDRQRREAASALGIRPQTLDRLVREKRNALREKRKYPSHSSHHSQQINNKKNNNSSNTSQDDNDHSHSSQGNDEWDDFNLAGKHESQAAQRIAEKLNGRYARDAEALTWHQFTGAHWQPLRNNRAFEAEVVSLMYRGCPDGFSSKWAGGVQTLLVKSGFLCLPSPPGGKVPFQNGLIDIQTKNLEPIHPENALTWVIPYDYNERAECPRLLSWLESCVDGDIDTVELLRAWVNALITGRSDLQRFLHFLGPAGTGKSTFIRLAEAIVGPMNATTTTLKDLEGNRFETAAVYGKRLVVITDSDKYGGAVNVLKAMTGEDPLRLERKHQQQAGSFIYGGQVLIASNEMLGSTDYTSGLERRRVTVEFNRRVTPEEREEWARMGGEVAVLHAEIPGIIRWALELSREEVTRRMNNLPDRTLAANLEAARFNSPLLDWLLESVVPAPGHWAKIGHKKEVIEAGIKYYTGADEELYPNYLRWCQRNGREQVALRRFSALAIEAAKAHGAQARKAEHRRSGNGTYGIRLRREDEEPWPVKDTSANVMDDKKTNVQEKQSIMNDVKNANLFSFRSYTSNTQQPQSDENEDDVQVDMVVF
ncbi:MAG: hypothetical protein BWK76_02530 [Desulfobulbaceae bacterium A2]|nr:MAG: hypothetical protein BWK76_02530 [Desulfobulbaceae bacterium A2]